MTQAPNPTREALILAAAEEIDTAGFDGTNTNAIARRAGFAPQTFYRHFKDKLAIFIAVYERWTDNELGVITGAGSAEALVRTTLAHHAATRQFRRALRSLTVSDPEVAAARAASRSRQLEAVRQRVPAFAARSPAAQIAVLFTFERLCDAVVEGEFERLGVEAEAVVQELVALAEGFGGDQEATL
ncbi:MULTISPECIES: TetR/AcrR family transcriptional regulator [unclassified Caulobacter]|uniref:TetR/AcrR family transcriptional regulator n=1 Tax=unclassified Caulobacter TaxID=2648921 RepID=UPI001304F49F|nr:MULTISPECIES: TetR/AcrR family transcriptional regulator [unclassified Caulobacter]